MKNVACSRLGTMLHLYIQKGKEAMKTSEFQKDLGDTGVRMKRLAMATKGCGELTSPGNSHLCLTGLWYIRDKV